MRAVSWVCRVLIALVLFVSMLSVQHAHAGSKPSGGISSGGGKFAPSEPLQEFLVTTVQGGYAASGAAMRNLGKGTIKLFTVPPQSTVEHAFLYWNILGGTKPRPEYASGTFLDVPLLGELVASGETPCWGDPAAVNSYTYRAEVTDLLNPTINGTYPLAGFASGRTDGAVPSEADLLPYLEGATLVVIYSNDRYPETTVFLYEGAAMTSVETGPVLTTISSLPDHPSYLAYTTYIIADGQSSDEIGAGLGAGMVLAPMPLADADGTDPLDRAGDYPGGNLWDTDRATTRVDTDDWGISVGYQVDWFRDGTDRSVSLYGGPVRPGDPGDCLVHVAQVLSVSDGEADTDGDSQPDAWEANGYDHFDDSKIDVDLPALGGNPFRQDVYLWIDYMAGHRPADETLADLVEIFNRGNPVNPDRRGGVNLHIHLGTEVAYREFWVDTCGPWPAGDGPLDRLDAARLTALSEPQRMIYHYQLWIDGMCPGDDPGRSTANAIPGDASLVATAGAPSVRMLTHAALHEFGHSLGLGHGGPGILDYAFSPNHLSIMSYLYDGGIFYAGAHRHLDYQRIDLPELDETCLDETAGLGSAALELNDTNFIQWNYFEPATGTVQPGEIFAPGAAAGPIDWNEDGVLETCLALSIDENPASPVGLREVLPAVQNEWRNLIFDGGDVGGPL